MAEIFTDQIPQELKQIQGWVNWISKKYPDEKKPRKIPINPNTGYVVFEFLRFTECRIMGY